VETSPSHRGKWQPTSDNQKGEWEGHLATLEKQKMTEKSVAGGDRETHLDSSPGTCGAASYNTLKITDGGKKKKKRG